MKKLLLVSTIISAAAIPAQADTIMIGDPLHGTVCSGSGTGCNATEIGGVVPGNLGSTGTFGFNSSPAGATGNLFVAILIPDNEIAGLTLPSISGTGLAAGSLFSAAGGGVDWTATLGGPSGTDLANFIFGASITSQPANPESAFATPESGFDPGLNGFFVFTANAGQIGPLNGQNAATAPDFFSLSGGSLAGLLPPGSVITGFMVQSDGSVTSTAPSGQISVPNVASVPAPFVGSGIPGIIAGVIGLLTLSRRRRAK